MTHINKVQQDDKQNIHKEKVKQQQKCTKNQIKITRKIQEDKTVTTTINNTKQQRSEKF